MIGRLLTLLRTREALLPCVRKQQLQDRPWLAQVDVPLLCADVSSRVNDSAVVAGSGSFTRCATSGNPQQWPNIRHGA